MENQQRPTVAFYSNPSSFGGSEFYLKTILPQLLSEDWDFVFFGGDDHPLREWLLETNKIRFISLGKYGLTPVEKTENLKQPVHQLSKVTWPGLLKRKLLQALPSSLKLMFGTIRQLIELRGLFLENPVDLIHFNDTGCEPAVVAARLAGSKAIIGTYHVSPGYQAGGATWVHRAIEWMSTRCMTSAIAVSEATKDAWVSRVRINGEGIRVIHNGIDVDTIIPDDFDRSSFLSRRGLNPERRYVSVPARLHWMKGHSVLFQAIASLPKSCDDVHFLLLGDGELGPKLASMAVEMGISERVTQLGFCSDVTELLLASEFVVLPSVALEALPLSLLEAMACGRAIVSTNVGGIPEMIDEGRSGYVVQAGDAVTLGAKIQFLVSNTEKTKEMGLVARSLVAVRFSLAYTRQATLAEFNQALASR